MAAFFYLQTGCVTTGHHPDLLSPVSQGPVMLESESPCDEDVSSDSIVAAVVRTDFSVVLADAASACDSSDFSSADSLYRSILPELVDGADDDSLESEFFAEIIQVYSSLMPDSIGVPEEITQQVFQQQMSLSLDTISFSEKDSIVIARLLSRPNVQHDVPVVWNERVKKALIYYVTRNQATVECWKKRAPVYLPFMKKMFSDSTLPQDLAYLPLIESGFNPKAYSRSHASGIWQFIPSTGKLYGMRINYWIDERRDPVTATRAAISYLKKLYNDFGHWHLALAAYNCGEGGVSRAIERYGTNDYWQLKLPGETMNYVPLYLAAVTIAKDSEFTNVIDGGDTIPVDTVSIHDCIDMREIASGISVPYDTLKMLNPHILHWCTPPDMSSIRLYLPAGKASEFSRFYASLPADKKVRWYRYRVRQGDNLGSIARHFKLPIEGIRSVNRLAGTRIIAGKYLFIPIPLGDNRYQAALADEETVTKKAVEVVSVPSDARHVVYEVKPGDTVWRLAELFGVTGRQIRGWNHLEGNTIKAGQILSIYTTEAGGEQVAVVSGEQTSIETTQPGAKGVSEKKGFKSYAVAAGDTYYGIAQSFLMSLGELYKVNDITAGSPLHPGDTLLVRDGVANSRAATTSLSSSEKNAESCIRYVVSPGDYLYRIAQNFSLSVTEICRVNRIRQSTILGVGDTLLIPQPASEQSLRSSSPVLPSVSGYYTVKNGDNLWRIAQFVGVPVENLYEYNGLQANSVLMPGDTIRYSKKDDL